MGEQPGANDQLAYNPLHEALIVSYSCTNTSSRSAPRVPVSYVEPIYFRLSGRSHAVLIIVNKELTNTSNIANV
ncbi:hypothetical protein GCM10007879_14610 [Maritalea porphyrae]|uniref:Uncharacterized protein n=1 Tax=Maritalea porphyrae TaxID=880732 RepID=A0ABQ5UTC0_9HYPH|nr:hypothetical protein GCM10007879_14610 [Maritalea porphyrae]